MARPSKLLPGARLWHFLMRQAPDEEIRQLLRDCFAAAGRQGCSDNTWDQLIAICREALGTFLGHEHDARCARMNALPDPDIMTLDALAEGEGEKGAA